VPDPVQGIGTKDLKLGDVKLGQHFASGKELLRVFLEGRRGEGHA